MEASDSQAGSYVWRSILKGRDVLKEGLRWKVGDGTSIRIWSDPWLPSKFLPYISSPIPSGWEDARVSSLFDSSQQVWNLATLQQLFNPRDAKLINSIPLSTRPIEDVLIWLFTQTGSYTVKSEYRFLYKSQSFDNNDYQPADNTLWRRFGGYKFSLRSKTSCGEHSRILFQPSLTSGEERSWRMIGAISVKGQPKMWFMRCGHVHFYHMSCLMTLYGIIMQLRILQVSKIWWNIS